MVLLGLFKRITTKMIRARDPSPTTSMKLPNFMFVAEQNAAYKNYALQICINKLADALALCEFQTFRQGKQIEESMWYRFNIEPNKNQNQTEFWNKIIYKMVYCADGALVIQSNDGQFIVADDFSVTEYAFLDNVYSDIVLPGNYRLPGTRLESDVLHFKLHNSKIHEVVNSIYDDYGKIIAGTIRNYNRGNSIKMQLSIDSIFEQFKNKEVIKADGTKTNEYNTILEDLFENKFKPIFDEKDSITPMQKGLTLEKIDNSNGGNTKSGTHTTRDIYDAFNDIINTVADAFGVPRGLLKGDVADNEGLMKMFITFPVRSLVDNLQTEINRKIYKEAGLLKGNKLKIQTNTIRTYDPVDVAAAAEALYRIGSINSDYVRVNFLNEEPLNTELSQAYFVTKNYEKEGETNDQNSN